MGEKLKLYGFNNLTKALSFNIYDVCYAKTPREQRDYISYIDEQYNSERLTNILTTLTDMIGAQVLNNRSVEMAKKYNVEIEVLSSLKRVPGTIVKEVAKMEKMLVRGVTKDTDVARISVKSIPNNPGVAFKLFAKLAQKKINVDIILQSIGRDDTKDITFTVSKENADEAVKAVHDTFDIDDKNIVCDTEVAKISVVGAGMESPPGTASKMFEALYEHDINIDMISTSEIKISVLINAKDADRAVSAVHKAFYPAD